VRIELETVVSDQIMDRIKVESDEAGISPAVMATGAILVVEVLHEDGNSYLHSLRPEGTTSWAAVGMAEHVKHWLLSDEDDE